MPEILAARRLERHHVAVHVSREDQAGRRRQHAGHRGRVVLELPPHAAGRRIDRPHRAEAAVGALRGAAEVVLAGHELLLPAVVDRTHLARRHIEETRRRVVGRRHEVGAAGDVGTHLGTRLGGLGVGPHGRPAIRIDLLGPGGLHERPRRQHLSVGAIERVVEAVAVREQEDLASDAVDDLVCEHRYFGGIPVVRVVWRELIVPRDDAAVGVEGHDRVGVEVVALAIVPVEVGTGIPRAPVDQVQRGIVAAGDPGGAAAALPRIAFPRLVALFPWTRHRPEAPRALASGGVVGIDEPTDAVLRSGDTDHHLVLHDERRRRGAVTQLVVVNHHVPHDRAGLHVEGQEVRVERVHVELVAEHGEAAVDASATDIHVVRQVAAIAPELAPGARVDRPRGVVWPGDVDDPVDDDRRGLELAELRGLERPAGCQLVDVRRADLRERAVALAAVVAAVVHPRLGVGQAFLELRVRDGLRVDQAGRYGQGGAGDERDCDVSDHHISLHLPRSDRR